MQPACNGTDERLDAIHRDFIAEIRKSHQEFIERMDAILGEIRMIRQEWKEFEASVADAQAREVTIEHYKDIPPMDVPGRKPPKRTGK